MLEIQPVSPSFPVVKPKKIDREDSLPEKQQRRKKQEEKEHEAEPIQHIDEIA
jgi:hypothetical protein